MSPLRLSPLPTIRPGDDDGSRMYEREGFVDEAVVSALRRDQDGPFRSISHPSDLVLAADDLDFAGWHSNAAPQQAMIGGAVLFAGLPRRPDPPLLNEPGLGTPHSGNHRWWLAGLAGAFSTLLFSLVLVNLSTRPGSAIGVLFVPEPPERVAAPMAEKPDMPKPAAELTEVSRIRP